MENNAKRVIVGMSGGVDSSVAALVAKLIPAGTAKVNAISVTFTSVAGVMYTSYLIFTSAPSSADTGKVLPDSPALAVTV